MESLSKLSPHCPRWDELPRLALYMDQVCIAVGDALGPFLPCQEYALTATMVNNYVKQRLITPPEKKKYSPLHVSRLIMIQAGAVSRGDRRPIGRPICKPGPPSRL